jgi:RND superfamily putative drug exporter
VPAGVLVGGPVAENHDLDQTLRDKAPLVMGVVLVLGFLLLIVALQGLIVALIGVIFNLLSVGAAFGVGALAFQHGGQPADGFREPGLPHLVGAAVLLHPRVRHLDGLHGVPAGQRPVSTSSARTTPDEAVIRSIAHTGRPIMAAAGIMVAVFYTFAIAGTLPMKEMGLILGTAVLLDALIVRLVLVPAVLHLVGRKAWWLPRWVDRIVPDVRFAH